MSHGVATRLPQTKTPKKRLSLISIVLAQGAMNLIGRRHGAKSRNSPMSSNTHRRPVTLGMCAASALLFMAHAEAGDLPARKPGLWEVKTTIEGHGRGVTVQQCIDAATDQMLQSSAGPFSAPACPEREVKKSDTGMTIDSRCNFNGKAASAHADITGSFDSTYTMMVTAEGADLPHTKMTSEGKWLGACAADQQPGDVVMANGVKINIPELQKRALPPNPSQPGN
jgi:hypothetical protein